MTTPVLPKLEGYVIYNPATGLYAKGGIYGVWSPRPKIWSSASAVKNHLSMYVNSDYEWKVDPVTSLRKIKSSIVISKHYKDCVVLNLVDNTEPFKIYDYLTDKATREAKRHKYPIVDEWEEE